MAIFTIIYKIIHIMSSTSVCVWMSVRARMCVCLYEYLWISDVFITFVNVCFPYLLLVLLFRYFFLFCFHSRFYFSLFLLLSHFWNQNQIAALFCRFCILTRNNGSMLTCCQHSTHSWKWQSFNSLTITLEWSNALNLASFT